MVGSDGRIKFFETGLPRLAKTYSKYFTLKLS